MNRRTPRVTAEYLRDFLWCLKAENKNRKANRPVALRAVLADYFPVVAGTAAAFLWWVLAWCRFEWCLLEGFFALAWVVADWPAFPEADMDDPPIEAPVVAVDPLRCEPGDEEVVRTLPIVELPI